jgi:large subunit ribosomal protein L4
MIRNDLEFTEPKTKIFANLLKSMNSYQKKTLLLLDAPKDAVIKSARNIAGVKIILDRQVNVYDVLWADKIIITESAIKNMEEVFAA